jgi:hypothetical protein
MQTIPLLQPNDKDEDVAKQIAKVWVLCNADSDAEVVLDSGIVETNSGAYILARTQDDAAQVAAGTATRNKNTKKGYGITSYNALAKKVMEKHPGMFNLWKDLGFPLTKIASSKTPCEKITGGKWEQWVHDGFAVLSWGSLGTEADYYMIEECTGDPAVEANWYAANEPNSKEAKDVIVKPKTLNVPTWWRVTGWNSAGAGVAPSDPFGGKPIH